MVYVTRSAGGIRSPLPPPSTRADPLLLQQAHARQSVPFDKLLILFQVFLFIIYYLFI